MFRVEPHQLLYIYAALGVGAVAVAALLHAIRRAKRERAALRGVVKCGLCAFHFKDERRMVHPRCPNCGALVEARPLSRL